ncbi:MAG: hypothetical protein ACR2G4_04740 [Pyrinomonadaceae bacterium]
MGKLSKNPEAIRQSAIELITLLLQERQRRHNSESYEANYREVKDSHIYDLISGVLLWRYSEAEGHKYKDCRYWSEGALRSRERHGKVVTSRKQVGGDALRHEHIFPRNEQTAKLFSIVEPTVSAVRDVLERLNIAVIVTHEEHELLSRKGDEIDPWERYRKAGIRWRNICENNDAQSNTSSNTNEISE